TPVLLAFQAPVSKANCRMKDTGVGEDRRSRKISDQHHGKSLSRRPNQQSPQSSQDWMFLYLSPSNWPFVAFVSPPRMLFWGSKQRASNVFTSLPRSLFSKNIE